MHTTILKIEITSKQTPEELESTVLEEFIEQLESNISDSNVRLISATEK
jgi:hypothetical protein